MEFFKVVSPEEAKEALEGFRALGAESVSSFDAVGRVLACDVHSPVDLPDFPRATMDGYALKAADSFGASESIPAYLDIVGQVPMGAAPEFSVGRGEAARILTGGMVPEGADAVVMEEFTTAPDAETLEVRRPAAVGENILGVGDDLKKDELILGAGARLRSQDIGALAGVGITSVEVHRRPRVAILPTGDELIDPRETPRAGQVRDINRFSLAAGVVEAGGAPETEDILPDNLAVIKERLEQAVSRADVVLISGGSSMGLRDYTVEAIDSLGEPGVLVHGISIKPGKPTIIGRIVRDGGEDKAVIGIPGHPVSALMIFHAFVRPVIRQLSGEVVREDLKFRWSCGHPFKERGLGSRTRGPGSRHAFNRRGRARGPSPDGQFRDDIDHDEGGRLHHDSARSGRAARGRASARASLLSAV